MKMTMRKLLAILATLAMLCTVLPLGTLFSATADEANLFVNGDFETGNADGWRTWQDTEIIADAAHSGSFGAHLVGNGGWGGMLDQTIAVEPGNTYVLSFWINVNAMGCNVQVKDGAGNAIAGAGGWFDANNKNKVVEWVFTATDNSVFVNFCGSGNQPEDVYVDDFKLVCLGGGSGDEPGSENMIPNGDFETGILAPWVNLYGGCPTAEIISGGMDSEYAVNIVSKQWNHVRQTGIAVEPNTDYKITAWAKNANNMCLLVKDGADTTDIKNVGVNAGDEWTEFVVEFNSGEFTSIIFSLMGGAGENQYGVFDNIVMTKVGGGDEPGDEPTIDPPVAPEVPENAIVNDNFDNGETQGWSSSSTIAVVDGVLEFQCTQSWANIYKYVNAMKPNTDYVYRFNARANMKQTMNIKVNNNWAGDTGKGIVDVTTEWQTYEVVVNSGDLTATPLVLFSSNVEASAGLVLYLDNISIAEVAGEEPDPDPEPAEPSFDGYLYNGDFETGVLADGWKLTSGSGLSGISAEGAKDGNYGFKLEGDAYGEILYSHPIAIVEGATYTIDFDVKTLNRGEWNFQVKRCAADNAGAGSNFLMEYIGADTVGEWKHYTYSFVADILPDRDHFSLLFVVHQNTDFYIDNVVITSDLEPEEPDVPALPEGVLVDDNFDDDTLGAWASSSDVSNDNGALKFVPTADYGMVYTTVSVEPNTDYEFTFKAKSALGKSIWVKFNDSWGPDVASETVGIATSWKDYKVTLNSGDCTELVVLLQYAGVAADGETIWFDSISIKKAGGVDPEPPVASGNLVVNGDFEAGNVDGWEVHSDTAVSADAAKNGSYGVIAQGPGTWGGLLSQTIPVVKGKEYTLSFWVKAVNKGVNVQVVQDTWQGEKIEGVGGGWYNNTEWKYVENTFVAPCDAIFFNVCGGGTEATETVYFDDISLVEAGADPEPPASSDVLVNGGFENGSDGWQLADGMATIVDDARTGNGALQLQNVGMWAGAALQTVPVKPNTNYVIELWYKREVGTKPFNLYTMNGETNENLKRAEGSGDNWFNTADADWTLRKIIVETGDATSMTLKWSAETVNDGIMLIDDMKVYPEGEEPVDPPVADDNPVKDGGFESGVLDPNIMPGGVAGAWYNVWGSNTVTFIEPGHNGSKYAIEMITGGSWAQVRQDQIPVEPNTEYVVEAYVRNPQGMGIVIKEGYDSFDLTAFEVGQIPDDTSNTWKKHVFEFNSGKDKDGNDIDPIDSICLLIISPDAGSSVEIDNIRVVKKSEYGAGEYAGPIVNSGFETGDLSSWNNLWNSCKYSFEAPGRNGSKFALDFSAEGQWKQIRQDKIPVEPNTDYVLLAHSKNANNVNVVVKTEDDTTNIADFGVPNDVSNQWVRHEIAFNSGAETKVSVLLITNSEAGGSALWDDVQIFKAGEVPAPEEPDEPVVTEGPVKLDYYTMANNRPITPEANLIVNSSFEDAEGGQWQSILSDVLTVVDDETAPDGNKSLYFNTSGKEYDEKTIFYVDVEQNTDYVFSAWVKGAFISDTNRFKATFGVVDYKQRFAVYEDHVFSNTERQIVPPAWDNEWHLRSVGFNSGANIKIGIAITGGYSQMWLDGIALFKVDDGIKYTGEKQTAYIIASPLYAEEGGCADEHNILPDANMDGDEIQEFWASAEGYKNGFLSFAENKYEYGTSLKYTASEKAVGTYAIKWLEVKPNTTYTFSIDLRILESGAGKFVLLDGKKRECYPFLMVDFDKEGYGEDWFTVAIEFNTGVFDRIGLAVADGGGEALLDNMRLFESVNRAEVEDDYITPPAGGETPDKPGSPDTGVSVFGAAVAMALVPSAAAVAFKLRRKKEDEE